jgi:hypothetical protein
MRKFRVLLAILFAFFLSSCSAPTSNLRAESNNVEDIDTGKVRLIFKREKDLFYYSKNAQVNVNGKLVTKLENGSTFYYDVEKTPSGLVEILIEGGSFDFGQYKLSLNIEDSKIYRLSIEPNAGTGKVVSRALLGLPGMLIDQAVNKSQNGPFKIWLAGVSN